MMRYLVALLVAGLALPAHADCVWTTLNTLAAKVVCGDGDEVAPSAATDGLALDPGIPFGNKPRGLSIVAAADATRTITSGTLKAYVYSDDAAAWARVPELDLTVSEAGNRYVSWSGFNVTVPKGRIAYIPSVVVLSAGGITVYLQASP
jgi:hypothetical protein